MAEEIRGYRDEVACIERIYERRKRER